MLELRLTPRGLEEALLKRWCLACYLVINWKIKDLVERYQVAIPMDVYKEVANHVYAYLYEDKMPPEALSPTILNLAEDVAAGRSVEIKAGDYIAIQNYMRAKKK